MELPIKSSQVHKVAIIIVLVQNLEHTVFKLMKIYILYLKVALSIIFEICFSNWQKFLRN